MEVVDAAELDGVEKTEVKKKDKKPGEVPKWKKDAEQLRAAMAASRALDKELAAKGKK